MAPASAAPPRKRVGICLYGRNHDKKDEKFRPSLALATQEVYKLDDFYLLYQKDEEEQSGKLLEEIKAIYRSRGNACRPHRRMIAFDDIFDFNSVLRAIKNALGEIASTVPDGSELFLGVATGTHVMQIAMYFIGDRQRLGKPTSLVYVGPGEGRGGASWKAACRPISLNWNEYVEITAGFQNDRRNYAQSLFPYLIGADSRWSGELEMLAAVASETEEPILLLGETCTGKSRLADQLHAISRRKDKQYIPFNCATLNGSLADSALFGHARGAFTGAVGEREGLLDKADGGTLFLDEIGELESGIQAKLLTALEEKKYYRLGEEGGEERKSDFRLIAATNRDLEQMTGNGKFRSDLLARINNWTFTLPRLVDLRDCWDSALDKALDEWMMLKDRNGERRAPVSFDPKGRAAFLDLASRHDWKGNFRDFNNMVWRLATAASLEHFGAGNRSPSITGWSCARG